MEKKITKLDKLKLLLAFIDETESEQQEMFHEFVAHEIELAEKKQATAKKENSQSVGFSQAVLSALNKEGMRASELLDSPLLIEYAQEHDFPLRIQRITSALNKLTDGADAPVERFEVKRVAYFRLK